jgi:hypothetical protein
MQAMLPPNIFPVNKISAGSQDLAGRALLQAGCEYPGGRLSRTQIALGMQFAMENSDKNLTSFRNLNFFYCTAIRCRNFDIRSRRSAWVFRLPSSLL